MDQAETKRCNRCGQEKPLGDFYRHAKAPDGRQYTCKECAKESARQWAKEHPDRHLENMHRHMRTQKYKETRRALADRKRETLQAQRQDWYSRNRSKIASQRRERYRSDPEFRAKSLANTRRWQATRRGAHAKWWREYFYGLTPEEYDAMLIAQLGRCAICDEQADLVVDHDHNSADAGARGLLCKRCNHGLGHFRDDPGYLLAAARYLRKHNRS